MCLSVCVCVFTLQHEMYGTLHISLLSFHLPRPSLYPTVPILEWPRSAPKEINLCGTICSGSGSSTYAAAPRKTGSSSPLV